MTPENVYRSDMMKYKLSTYRNGRAGQILFLEGKFWPLCHHLPTNAVVYPEDVADMFNFICLADCNALFDCLLKADNSEHILCPDCTKSENAFPTRQV